MAQQNAVYSNYVSHGPDLTVVQDIIRFFPKPDIGWNPAMRERTITLGEKTAKALFDLRQVLRQHRNPAGNTKTHFDQLKGHLSSDGDSLSSKIYEWFSTTPFEMWARIALGEPRPMLDFLWKLESDDPVVLFASGEQMNELERFLNRIAKQVDKQDCEAGVLRLRILETLFNAVREAVEGASSNMTTASLIQLFSDHLRLLEWTNTRSPVHFIGKVTMMDVSCLQTVSASDTVFDTSNRRRLGEWFNNVWLMVAACVENDAKYATFFVDAAIQARRIENYMALMGIASALSNASNVRNNGKVARLLLDTATLRDDDGKYATYCSAQASCYALPWMYPHYYRLDPRHKMPLAEHAHQWAAVNTAISLYTLKWRKGLEGLRPLTIVVVGPNSKTWLDANTDRIIQPPGTLSQEKQWQTMLRVDQDFYNVKFVAQDTTGEDGSTILCLSVVGEDDAIWESPKLLLYRQNDAHTGSPSSKTRDGAGDSNKIFGAWDPFNSEGSENDGDLANLIRLTLRARSRATAVITEESVKNQDVVSVKGPSTAKLKSQTSIGEMTSRLLRKLKPNASR